MTVHAIITPWPISEGIRTWCGYDAKDERVSADNVASRPEAIDCEQCKRAMQQAYVNLSEWLPGLS
jgi:hypothetical protein